jgi:hypothetical protein
VAITPINYSRVSPPVEGVGDKQLERSRREFLDLIKSDERRHNSDSRRGNSEQQSQQSDALEARRQAQAAGDQARSRPALVPAGRPAPKAAATRRPEAAAASPGRGSPDAGASLSTGLAGRSAAMSPTARAMLAEQVAPVTRRDPQARDGGSGELPSPRVPAGSAPDAQPAPRSAGAAAPARQPSPIGAPPPPEALPRWPAPPPGSSLVAPAAEARSLNLVADAPSAAPTFRLSSEVPREVADRIAHFMRTGSLDRAPFSFAQVTPVADHAERVPTPEEVADQAVASLLAEAAPHMRLPPGRLAPVNSMASNRTVANLGSPLLSDVSLPGHLAAQAAIQAQAGLQPPVLVSPVAPRKPGIVPEQPRPSAVAALPGHLDRTPHGQLQNSQISNGQATNGKIRTDDVNPLFAPAPFAAVAEDDDDDRVIDLIAGPRRDTRRDRIA